MYEQCARKSNTNSTTALAGLCHTDFFFNSVPHLRAYSNLWRTGLISSIGALIARSHLGATILG